MIAALTLAACGAKDKNQTSSLTTPAIEDFNYQVEKFADMEIIRYRVANIEHLTTKQKELLYYLTEAALQGRDILFDQNGKYNLTIRRTLEAIYQNSTDSTSTDFLALELYLKRIWVSNGIYHHYSGDKFMPEFSKDYFVSAVRAVPADLLPLQAGETADDLLARLDRIMFDPTYLAKHTNQADDVDVVVTSAANYYNDVIQKEAEAFYAAMKIEGDTTPISYGLNSRLVKENGVIKEEVYKVGGRYTEALEKVVYWLEKAAQVTENEQQKAVIEKLIDFNKTGNLKTFDEYAILWVADTASHLDYVLGFTETYGDPLGMKASWEGLINFKDVEATKRTQLISDNAQWFETNSPIDNRFKKEEVRGVTAKVITAAMLGGDCYPTSPLGINLPNSNWIRAEHGSKSVTIENVSEAYNQSARGNGFSEEFMWSQEEIDLANNYQALTNNLHTDLHECLGHGSGKLLPGVDPDALKNYGAVIEETRADLFGLYFMADDKMVELGLLPNKDAYKAQYYYYFMNGLMTQLTRIQPGKNIEQTHMRNRQLLTSWVLEKSAEDKAVELRERDGKTFVVINNYELVHQRFGELLAEVQRIKSTGDFNAARNLVETYAVKVDQPIHTQVLDRYSKLNIMPYKGFVNPVYKAVYDKDGKFIDLQIDYTEGYAEQHLRYSKDYSPLKN